MHEFPNIEKEPEIKIMKASPADARGLREVQHQTWLATYANEKTKVTPEDIDWYFNNFKKVYSERSLEKTAQDLETQDGGVALVAKEGEKIVGYAWFLCGEDYNELGAIYILPEYHGRGIGKKLWEQGQIYFDQKKPTVVRLEENNESAKAFYANLGFQDAGKRFPSGLTFPSGATFNEAEMEMRPVVEKHE